MEGEYAKTNIRHIHKMSTIKFQRTTIPQTQLQVHRQPRSALRLGHEMSSNSEPIFILDVR
ncbi:hypothetical protein BGZ83_004436 [Gryganskiella cystojenkinii]|nr:hypothetical protein BGZ83_004436 [Gryganskiella cystojenkinii]